MGEQRSAQLRIGTSGWSYRSWKDDFYEGVPQRRWLEHCARHFTGIEANATFYRQPKPKTLASWREQTPPDFAFAVKGHRFVTHVRRLQNVREPIGRCRDALEPLGEKLAVMLWQLPPTLECAHELLDGFARDLKAWPEPRHVVEFRHESWHNDETRERLERHGLGTCISDAPRWPIWEVVTGGLAYVRLHGHEKLYASRYAKRGLEPWAERVREWRAAGHEVHVYFDNDAEAAAPDDAQTLIAMLRDDDRAEHA